MKKGDESSSWSVTEFPKGCFEAGPGPCWQLQLHSEGRASGLKAQGNGEGLSPDFTNVTEIKRKM